MKRFCAFVGLAMMFVSYGGARGSPSAVITLDPRTTYQTIEGWEATAWVNQENPSYLQWRDTLVTRAVTELGITRLRLEVRSLPGTTAFDLANLDWKMLAVVVPMRQVMQANGETLWLNICYVGFNTNPNLKDDSSAYAQNMLAAFQHMQSKYGFVPDSVEVELEPDSLAAGQWTPQQLANALLSTSRLLAQNGYHPKFIAPSDTNGNTAIRDFRAMMAIPGVADVLSEMSYHRYIAPPPASIGQLWKEYHVNTAMLEHIGSGYENLHTDLTIANNSAWERYVLGGTYTCAECVGGEYYHVDATTFAVSLNPDARFLRQYFRYIRPGAVRIEAASTLSDFSPAAFVNADGSYVVVVSARGSGSFSLEGLPAGAFGIKYTTGKQYNIDLPDVTIGMGRSLDTSIPDKGVITVYGKTSSGAPTAVAPTRAATEVNNLTPTQTATAPAVPDTTPSNPPNQTPTGGEVNVASPTPSPASAANQTRCFLPIPIALGILWLTISPFSAGPRKK